MESIRYTQAQVLAASLTEEYNKFHYTYSEACWEASNVFREKHLHLYGIIPMVYYVDGKMVVKAELSEEVKRNETRGF